MTQDERALLDTVTGWARPDILALVRRLDAEVTSMRTVMDGIHTAIGEDPYSEDTELPKIILDIYQTVKRLDAENERMRDELTRLMDVVSEVDHAIIKRALAGKR